MACLNRQFARIATSGARTLLFLALAASQVYAQGVPARLRGAPDQPDAQPAPLAAATPATAPAAQPAPAQQPQSPAPVSQVAPSMLQQPASEAQIVFTGDTLSIRADNSSLTAILRQVASKSGMQIEGLSSDERVFGTFGPGAPRDVIADLLNGTAYNVVLLGGLSDGAPRQLILTPASHGGAVPLPSAQAPTDEASNEPDAMEAPPPPDVPPGTTPPPTPAVKTPQQLFEQLQRMRSAQQGQVTSTQDPQQQQPQQPPPPQQQ